MKKIMTKEYILECLEKYCCFDMLHQYNFEEQVVYQLKINKCFSNWTWDCGATKGVLIFSELNFVVKIPFSGQEECSGSHYEDSQGNSRWNYIGTHTPSKWIKVEGESKFYDFCGAKSADEDNNWNYCQAESELSIKAKNAGLAPCFAITSFLGFANGYPIYIQDRCSMFSDESSSTNKEKYKNRTREDYKSLREVRERVDFWSINDDWLLDFLIYFGEEILERLANFIFDNDIEDLHNGNIGYIKGVPCLVDYSSYRE